MKNTQSLEDLYKELKRISENKGTGVEILCVHQMRERGAVMSISSQNAPDFLFFDYLTII